MPIIQQTHQTVFNWLYDWNKRVRGNPKMDETTVNPYFYLRTKEDERFKKGFWFPGDSSYMCISFWTGGDTKNRTPNAYLEFHEKKGVRIMLIARDSEKKRQYFEKLANHLGGFKESSKGVFIKVLQEKSTKDYPSFLAGFVDNEKKIIDKFLKDTLDKIDEEDYYLLQDEYSSKFGFLTVSQFDVLVSNVLRQREKLLTHNDIKGSNTFDPYTYKFKAKEFIYLNSFSLAKFKGIKNCSIEGITGFVNWIFITGENGFGKTCVLQGMALGLTDYPENFQYYQDILTSDREASIPDISVVFNYGKERLTNFLSTVNSSTFRNINKYFIAYGANRTERLSESNENMETSGQTNISSLFRSIGPLKNIDYEVKKYYHSDKKRLQRFKALISEVTKGKICDIIIKGYEVAYVEKAIDGNLPPVSYENLAMGFKSILNLVTDIYVRFSESQRTINPSRFKGIVCIDELENHLHAKYQIELPSLLSSVFPGIQFIATTHSPLPIIGATQKYCLIKVTRTVKDGVSTRRLDTKIDFRKLLPNALLTSPAFDLESLVKDKARDFTQLGLEDDYNEKVFYDILIDKLENDAKQMNLDINTIFKNKGDKGS